MTIKINYIEYFQMTLNFYFLLYLLQLRIVYDLLVSRSSVSSNSLWPPLVALNYRRGAENQLRLAYDDA